MLKLADKNSILKVEEKDKIHERMENVRQLEFIIK